MIIKYFLKDKVVHTLSVPMTVQEVVQCLEDLKSGSPGLQNWVARLLEVPFEHDCVQLKTQGHKLDALAPCAKCGAVPEWSDVDFVYPTDHSQTTFVATCCAGGCGCGHRVRGSTEREAIDAWSVQGWGPQEPQPEVYNDY